MTKNSPIFYSFRRCPYAMRARLGLYYAKIKCELREVVLRDKPAEMIVLSPKATVPVLLLPDGNVIDESYDIIKWALQRNDPDEWKSNIPETDILVRENDGRFKTALDKYKYSSRFPEHPLEFYREQGEEFLTKLNQMLTHQTYLLGDNLSLADISIFPFVRQFAHVDKDWFYQAPYPDLQEWVIQFLNSDLFNAIMKKYPKWHQGDDATYFPDLDQCL